jgi:hypothetical protein
MSSQPRRLLIMSCSQRKRPDDGLLPAIKRYDGPPFRVLRRFLKGQPTELLDVHILSAKFGLVAADQPIPNYDQRMTPARAKELNPEVITRLRYLLNSQPYQSVCFCMGQDYLRALDGYDTLISSKTTVKIATGSSGRKLSELHGWLYGEKLIKLATSPRNISKGKAYLKGVELVMTATEILDVARNALTEEQKGQNVYYSWYVSVDGKKVAPKWLVSRLTGLPLKSFTTSDARRVLEALGIEVSCL